MYAVKLGVDLFSPDSHTAVRDLLQDLVDKNKIKKDEGIGQTLRYFMIMAIAPPKLISEYTELSQSVLKL
jgi:hypothetical protein